MTKIWKIKNFSYTMFNLIIILLIELINFFNLDFFHYFFPVVICSYRSRQICKVNYSTLKVLSYRNLSKLNRETNVIVVIYSKKTFKCSIKTSKQNSIQKSANLCSYHCKTVTFSWTGVCVCVHVCAWRRYLP